MNVIRKRLGLCPCCMEEHVIQTVNVQEECTVFGIPLTYTAEYDYCDRADTLFAGERQLTENYDARLIEWRKKSTSAKAC